MHMYIKANENSALYNDATIDISGVQNALADNQGTTKLSSNKVIHQGIQFQAVQSSSTQSSISLKNTCVNTNQILFKSQENRVTNTYDAYQKATGVTSIYNSPGLLGTDIFSGNTSGNSCGTWGVMASKIDIGNQADEILIGTNALGGMGFDADVPATTNFNTNTSSGSNKYHAISYSNKYLFQKKQVVGVQDHVMPMKDHLSFSQSDWYLHSYEGSCGDSEILDCF